MNWILWIAGTCLLSSFLITICQSSKEKHDLDLRISVLETKVMVLLEERKK